MTNNENGCPMQPNINELTSSIKVLVERTDSLIALNRDVIRWLLVVVCVIALGRSAFDVGKDIAGNIISPAKAESIE